MSSVAAHQNKTDGNAPFIVPTAQDALETALRAGGLSGKANAIFAVQPEIKSVCENLARYMLRVVPTEDGREVLLDRCLLNGFEAFQQANTGDQVAAFCRGALSRAHEMMFWAVHVNKRFDGAICWDCVSMPLCDWISVHLKEPQVTYRTELQHTIIEASAFREILAFKIVPASAILRLKNQIGEIIS